MHLTASDEQRIRKMVKRARASPQKVESTTIDGWSFVLSFGHLEEHWSFSAKLFPPGRSSVIEDWENLGIVLAAFAEATGVVNESDIKLLTPFETTDPNAAHHYIWPAKPRC